MFAEKRGGDEDVEVLSEEEVDFEPEMESEPEPEPEPETEPELSYKYTRSSAPLKKRMVILRTENKAAKEEVADIPSFEEASSGLSEDDREVDVEEQEPMVVDETNKPSSDVTFLANSLFHLKYQDSVFIHNKKLLRELSLKPRVRHFEDFLDDFHWTVCSPMEAPPSLCRHVRS
jgi:hypothetical protein